MIHVLAFVFSLFFTTSDASAEASRAKRIIPTAAPTAFVVAGN
jgi:hypothetical protein